MCVGSMGIMKREVAPRDRPLGDGNRLGGVQWLKK